MNKGRFYDEMDIQAVESKLNDVTVTAIPMSALKQHHHNNSASQHYNSTSSSSSKSYKNQSNVNTNTKYLTQYQQNQLIQSAIQLVQQQQLQQQQRQLLENGVTINSRQSSSSAATANQSYNNYGEIFWIFCSGILDFSMKIVFFRVSGNSARDLARELTQQPREISQNSASLTILPQPASQQATQQQQTSNNQNSGLTKYAQLLAVIEEMGRDIRPTYANGRGDRLKRLIIQAKVRLPPSIWWLYIELVKNIFSIFFSKGFGPRMSDGNRAVGTTISDSPRAK